MRLRPQELKETDSEAQKLQSKEGYKEVEGGLHHQGLPFVPEAIWTKLINRHHNDPLASHFCIKKICELFAQKYFWPSLRHNVEAYIKVCDVCLALKAVKHKPYSDLQSLQVPTHWCKDLSMDFVTGLPILTNWKGDTYDSILVIVDRITKMVYYAPIKITINASGLAEVIIHMVVCHHSFLDSIITDRGSLFTSKFWSLLCYFFGIKRRLSTAFHPQTDGQTKRQNSTIEAYLRVFVNFKQNDWARLLRMAEFAYNNAEIVSTGHTPFELNCGYHLCVSFEKDTNSCSQSKTADKLLAKLQKLMTVCRENLHHAQELQKWAHNKGVKPKSYAPGDKVWLNSKYIKTKQNRKLEAKFFGPFRVLHPVGKQAYKLELPKKWRIHNVFHVSLLEQDTTRKEQVEKVPELNTGNNSKKYEIEAIWDSAVYTMESELGHLPGLYYLVAWKGYPEEENTWEPVLAVQHLKKLINSFYKDHSKKPTASSPPVNSAPPMARPTVKLTAKSTIKRKRGRPANSGNKQAKKN